MNLELTFFKVVFEDGTEVGIFTQEQEAREFGARFQAAMLQGEGKLFSFQIVIC